MIKETFNIQDTLNPEKYLGLPTMVGKGKKYAFRELKNKIESKLKGWSHRALSIGGKEVFLKVVIQYIPTYTMSCFILPKTFYKRLIVSLVTTDGSKGGINEASIGLVGMSCVNQKLQEA